MRAMILAAGRGLRMKHLTDHVPKPLLRIAGRYLIEYNILALAQSGIHDIVINVSYRADQIRALLGNGAQHGVSITYSYEEEPLETGGGVVKALPLLGKDAFILLSSDIISDYPLKELTRSPSGLAHIVLVNNPLFHPKGDFYLQGQQVFLEGPSLLTYANIGVYRPAFFKDYTPAKFGLGPLLKKATANQTVTGELFTGQWYNLGTPEQWAELNVALDNPQ